MPKHALLSASASKRWIACPPSARLCEGIADQTSEYALEGTECHEVCAYLVEKALGRDVLDPRSTLTKYSEEMQRCAEEYCSYVLEELEKSKEYCKDPKVFIEQRVDFSKWVAEGFGTADSLIIADKELKVIDYKHGLGVLVEAEENSQMMCYALGALEAFDGIYDIETISMTIFQPRRDNVSTWSCSKAELLFWAETVLKPAADMAFAGKGEYQTGEHCQFCKVKATCRKRAEENLKMAQYEFRIPARLSEEEIAAILPLLDQLVNWSNDVKEYALQEALNGTEYEGFKVVEGRSNRKYTDEAAVASAVTGAGYEPFEKKLLGITDMTSLLGRKKFEELLGRLVYKAPGKPTLVPVSDKRPAMNTSIEDFKENY